MASPSKATGRNELRALIAGASGGASSSGQRCLQAASADKGRPTTNTRKTRMSEDTLIKALRLFSRLGRVNACERPGHDCMGPLMGKVPRAKRILKMLSVVAGVGRKVVNADFEQGLLMNKDVESLQQMRRCAPGIGRVGSSQAPAPPVLNRELSYVEWAGLTVPVVMPSECACGCKRLTPRTLSRYGPTGVLDATKVHVILRQDVRCQGCQKQLYCSDEDVKRHFEAKGVYWGWIRSWFLCFTWSAKFPC